MIVPLTFNTTSATTGGIHSKPITIENQNANHERQLCGCPSFFEGLCLTSGLCSD